MAKYRADSIAARDKLLNVLSTAKSAYTKQLRIAEAEAVDLELSTIRRTGKVV